MKTREKPLLGAILLVYLHFFTTLYDRNVGVHISPGEACPSSRPGSPRARNTVISSPSPIRNLLAHSLHGRRPPDGTGPPPGPRRRLSAPPPPRRRRCPRLHRPTKSSHRTLLVTLVILQLSRLHPRPACRTSILARSWASPRRFSTPLRSPPPQRCPLCPCPRRPTLTSPSSSPHRC
jgi:hypothetical protein